MKPLIVCLCGSGRFREAFEHAEFDETLSGKIVLTIGCNCHDVARSEELKHAKAMLDDLHLRKIDLADQVFIVNVGGYVGESTAREIVYSESIGKMPRYLCGFLTDDSRARISAARSSRAEDSHGPNGRSGPNVDTGSTAANVDPGSATSQRKP